MTQQSPKPGLPSPQPFNIPAYWTPEQAQAVVELLDDLRERIVAHYQLQLIDLYREQHCACAVCHPGDPDDDLPF
jgi:hypothetical protein